MAFLRDLALKVQSMSYTDLAGNLGSAGSDVTLITPITYSSTDTGWLMNYNDNSNSFDMKVKGGSATISAGGSIYWDIIVHDNDGNAALTLNYGSLPKDQNNIPLAALSYEQLYSEGGEMIFRVYLTAISTITLSQPNQFDINVINASGASQMINTDEFVAPHSNYNDNYSLSFDSHAITEGHDQDWLSNDNNGGEFIGSITYQTGQTVSYLGGADVVYGTTGHDTLSGDAGNDYLDGRAGNDTLHGGADNDVLMGGYGNDVLYGDAGADTLYGNENNDTLIGGLGNDILTGGDGADIFKWTADDINIASGAPFSDTITDFSITEGDKLDLSDVLTGDTTTLSNYLDVQASGSDVEISVYANGINDGTPDMTILLQNPTDSLADLQVYLQSIGVIHNP